MKVVSFDVGIKNMAYCVLTMEHNQFQVQDWGILNLMNETPKLPCCDFDIKGKTPKKCGHLNPKKSKICKGCHDGRDSDNSEGGEDWGEGMDLD